MGNEIDKVANLAAFGAELEFDIQQDWGFGHGWEDVACETTPAAAVAQLNTYRENQPEVPARIKPNGSAARAALKAYQATL